MKAGTLERLPKFFHAQPIRERPHERDRTSNQRKDMCRLLRAIADFTAQVRLAHVVAEAESAGNMWVWVKMKPPGDQMFPLTRAPFWAPLFDPQPCDCEYASLECCLGCDDKFEQQNLNGFWLQVY